MRLALLILALVIPALVLPASSQDRDTAFRRLAERYFDEVYFPFNPTAGTSAGFHRYDGQLEDYSRAGVDRQAKALHAFLGEFERFSRTGLSADAASDYDLVVSNIRGTLLTLESIRPWEKNPDSYSSGVTASIFAVISRSFAPPAERLRSVIARERLIPAVFADARRNLSNPPRIYTEIALEQLPGIARFFRSDVPAPFTGVADAALKASFGKSNAAVLDALKDYEAWLRAGMLPQSRGDFRIGAGFYRQKLLYDEMVDTPLERLLEIGYQDLRRNQEEFRRVAAEIDSRRSPQQILQELESDHPAPAQLMDAFRGVLGGLRTFLEERHIITIPSPVPPIVEETPPFMRALTTASMDTPGPYENVATEGFFNVTLPDAGWPAKDVEEYMQGFNRGTIISTAVHEVFPGHYMQFLWLKQVPTKVRKLAGCGSNAEGWAHYTEQMMLDEGYGNGDRKLRLGQLQDALLRNARFIAGIEMHTGKMTVEQAKEFFIKEGYQVPPVAEKEAKRGTSDPTYLVYTLGKLQIMKLREDYKKRKGAAFSLQEFHDSFLKQGAPPIKIVRKALLGDDSPTL